MAKASWAPEVGLQSGAWLLPGGTPLSQARALFAAAPAFPCPTRPSPPSRPALPRGAL